jgi:hypothetical protein
MNPNNDRDLILPGFNGHFNTAAVFERGLGSTKHGRVEKIKFKSPKMSMARKHLTVDNPELIAEFFDQIKECVSPYLAETYRITYTDGIRNNLMIYTKYMNVGSLESILLHVELISKEHLAHITKSVRIIYIPIHYFN